MNCLELVKNHNQRLSVCLTSPISIVEARCDEKTPRKKIHK